VKAVTNPTIRARFEEDFKREIKKLQRYAR
jgi:hypothetical protein